MGKLTKKSAMREIAVSFGDLANRLDDRAATCTYAVDAELHRQSASAIRALLSGYTAALEANND